MDFVLGAVRDRHKEGGKCNRNRRPHRLVVISLHLHPNQGIQAHLSQIVQEQCCVCVEKCKREKER